MKECSVEGVKILRALALAVRSEQDFDLVPKSQHIVGVLKRANAYPADAIAVKQHCGFQSMLQASDYIPLYLREALNKIAHADPLSADYYIGPLHRNHDLLLYGENHGQRWFAAISVLELIKAIQSLPDTNVHA